VICNQIHRDEVDGSTYIRRRYLDTPNIGQDDIFVITHRFYRHSHPIISVGIRRKIDIRYTQKDDMYTLLLSFLPNLSPPLLRAIIRIINDDLSTRIEEVPDQLLTPSQYLYGYNSMCQ
jgi:hypothetical protein